MLLSVIESKVLCKVSKTPLSPHSFFLKKSLGKMPKNTRDMAINVTHRVLVKIDNIIDMEDRSTSFDFGNS